MTEPTSEPAAPGAVSLHVWRVPRRAVPAALVRMAADPRRLRAIPGLRFGKLLGTGTGDTFGPADADLTRYAALAVWADPAALARFEAGPVAGGWARLARHAATVHLAPLSSRGRWSGQDPFGPGPAPTPRPGPGEQGRRPVLALTRARLRPRRALTFWRAVPPVVAELRGAPGLLARFGIGEAPIGWQGTVSVWRDTADLVRFAYRQPEHRAVVTRTPTQGWYAEELFARFAVLGIRGDRSVLGWVAEGDDRA
ncbi:MAG TPA: monooxygenase [Pilimelia sp.]|nr:monooxygenase [Pilimelia sp.]